MAEYYPILIVGAIIGTFAILFVAAWLAETAADLRQRVIAGTAKPLPMKGG